MEIIIVLPVNQLHFLMKLHQMFPMNHETNDYNNFCILCNRILKKHCSLDDDNVEYSMERLNKVVVFDTQPFFKCELSRFIGSFHLAPTKNAARYYIYRVQFRLFS